MVPLALSTAERVKSGRGGESVSGVWKGTDGGRFEFRAKLHLNVDVFPIIIVTYTNFDS